MLQPSLNCVCESMVLLCHCSKRNYDTKEQIKESLHRRFVHFNSYPSLNTGVTQMLPSGPGVMMYGWVGSCAHVHLMMSFQQKASLSEQHDVSFFQSGSCSGPLSGRTQVSLSSSAPGSRPHLFAPPVSSLLAAPECLSPLELSVSPGQTTPNDSRLLPPRRPRGR